MLTYLERKSGLTEEEARELFKDPLTNEEIDWLLEQFPILIFEIIDEEK